MGLPVSFYENTAQGRDRGRMISPSSAKIAMLPSEYIKRQIHRTFLRETVQTQVGLRKWSKTIWLVVNELVLDV